MLDTGATRSSQDTMTLPVASSASRGVSASPRRQAHATKARFEALPEREDAKSAEARWGAVHLYRDGEENGVTASGAGEGQSDARLEIEDTTVLCIPAVPSYMTPSDFLGWVGERTRADVAHFRMVMTARLNRYLVLMKFRDRDVAGRWRAEWDGKVFQGMEPETCHVMFVKSIIFQTSTASADEHHEFPDMSHDPFTPNLSSNLKSTSLDLEPLSPSTGLPIDLPSCPVCLERMDDTGLVTILCQHVFHCACLQKWRGSGCPVCRYTQPYTSLTRPFGVSAGDLCQVCDCAEDLWICLICGNVGCGRYKGGHAKEHWKDTAHSYALEIETQHVWDYAEDQWVHRLIQKKGEEKMVDPPSRSATANTSYGFGGPRADERDEHVEMVPREKLDNICMEYTHILTSHLESQRMYFESVVKTAVDKARDSSKLAETATARAEEALSKLQQLTREHARLRDEIIPSLERDRDRVTTKAAKSSEVARSMTKSFQEEKEVGKGLMARITHLNEGMAKMSKELAALKEENADLKEQNRDLSFFISSQEKIKSIEGDLGEEIAEGTISLPERKEEKAKARGKGKGKAK